MAKTALVIGGSLAGLLSACALADAFDDILVLERAELPDDLVPRPTTPQGAHAHGLLAGGLRALEELLPGLAQQLMQSGCPSGDNLRDAAWVFGGRRLAIGDSGVRGMTMGRPLLEKAIRDRVLALPNVRILANVRCHGLLASGPHIVGVRVTNHGVDQELVADLVVDASGRSSKLPAWLVELGFAAPPVEEIAVETHYVTRVYSRKPQHLGGAIALVLVSDPHVPRGGIAVALDDHRWLVSQYAMGGTRPPRDYAAFVEFSRTLSGPQLADILGDAEPLGEAATLRFPSSIRRRYERVRRLPDGLVVIGDAMASFNPTDSLAVVPETRLVGTDAHGHTADWSQSLIRNTPTFDEVVAFIDEYERARTRPFTAAERRATRAWAAYVIAYGAWISVVPGKPWTAESWAGTLEEAGERLLL